MKLVIHDLKPDEWNKISQDYDGWRVIADRGSIRPCSGCFFCWNKTPGKCVINDGYNDIGMLFHHADEVVVISRYTYGGFSGFVKNVFDRCLGYALPQFEIVDGETHHKRRYDEDKSFSFIFYGDLLSEEEKESSRRYVKAVCTNLRGHVGNVIFRDCTPKSVPDHVQNQDQNPAQNTEYTEDTKATVVEKESRRIVILNGSMRTRKGNSVIFSHRLYRLLKRETKIISLKKYSRDLLKLIDLLANASDIVLCMPLYVDGLPSQVIRFLGKMQLEHKGSSKRIYVVANMGLYESRQLVNLFDAIRQWCGKMNYEYCGGIGIGAGELTGVLIQIPVLSYCFTRRVTAGIQQLAKAINSGEKAEDIYTGPVCFPRWLYIQIANKGWNKMARKNGIRPSDLYRQL